MECCSAGGSQVHCKRDPVRRLCFITQPLSEFRLSSHSADKHEPQCKTCHREGRVLEPTIAEQTCRRECVSSHSVLFDTRGCCNGPCTQASTRLRFTVRSECTQLMGRACAVSICICNQLCSARLSSHNSDATLAWATRIHIGLRCSRCLLFQYIVAGDVT